jgi:ABC-type transport system substrate-binding protein
MSLADPATHIGLDSFEDNLLVNYTPYGDGSGDLQAAKQEMAKSHYDHDGNGVCDAAVCRGVELLFPGDDPARTHIAEAIKKDLEPLGVDVALHGVPHDEKWAPLTADPSARVPMNIPVYVKDFPSGSNFFPSIFASANLTNQFGDPTLLGASSAQLRKWGYPVSSVPNVDDRLKECDEQIFKPQVQCWASFDQYLTEQLAPWVPLLAWTGAIVVSSRVEKFSWDQSTPFPGAAIDRIQLKPGSR